MFFSISFLFSFVILTYLCKDDKKTFSSYWKLKNLAGDLSGQLVVDNLAV